MTRYRLSWDILARILALLLVALGAWNLWEWRQDRLYDQRLRERLGGIWG